MRILITGGTGSFGRALARSVMQLPTTSYGFHRIVIYSRDEQKQSDMARELGANEDSPLRFMLGDVRDCDRLRMALNGIDLVVHAAALKIVPKCEYDPMEAMKTNVLGASNVIQAALQTGVKRVIALSTDKAVAPTNLYGATKLCADKMFISANNLSGSVGDETKCRFSVARYGNVANSRGSIIPLFREHANSGVPFPITDERMTRFWITLDRATEFILQALLIMEGGEIFIPKMPSFGIVDLAKAMHPFGNPELDIIGIRPGEKIHETLITEHDSRDTIEDDNAFVVCPPWAKPDGSRLPDGFTYTSGNNPDRLTVNALRGLIP